MLGIWLSITLLLPLLLLRLFKTFSLFLGNGMCLEMVLQLFTNLCIIVMRSLPSNGGFAEFQHTFLIRKHFVRNASGTPVRPPRSLARDRGLRVARNTFL